MMVRSKSLMSTASCLVTQLFCCTEEMVRLDQNEVEVSAVQRPARNTFCA